MELDLELRPQSLDDVIGHAEHKHAIRHFIKNTRHYWLFSGPTGTGKTTLAHIVAREIRGGEAAKPDVLHVDAGNARGIDDARELVRISEIYPMSGKHRVIVLNEAQELTREAQGLLLSAFEREWSDDSGPVWILCTTNPEKLEKPLTDRCIHFPLKPMTESQEQRELVSRAAKHLKYDGDISGFLGEIKKHNVCSAREIIRKFEKRVYSTPAEVGARS